MTVAPSKSKRKDVLNLEVCRNAQVMPQMFAALLMEPACLWMTRFKSQFNIDNVWEGLFLVLIFLKGWMWESCSEFLGGKVGSYKCQGQIRNSPFDPA